MTAFEVDHAASPLPRHHEKSITEEVTKENLRQNLISDHNVVVPGIVGKIDATRSDLFSFTTVCISWRIQRSGR